MNRQNQARRIRDIPFPVRRDKSRDVRRNVADVVKVNTYGVSVLQDETQVGFNPALEYVGWRSFDAVHMVISNTLEASMNVPADCVKYRIFALKIVVHTRWEHPRRTRQRFHAGAMISMTMEDLHGSIEDPVTLTTAFPLWVRGRRFPGSARRSNRSGRHVFLLCSIVQLVRNLYIDQHLPQNGIDWPALTGRIDANLYGVSAGVHKVVGPQVIRDPKTSHPDCADPGGRSHPAFQVNRSKVVDLEASDNA